APTSVHDWADGMQPPVARPCGLRSFAFGTQPSPGVGSIANAQRAIQMFIDNDAASSQCRAKACRGNLKDAIGELDGVVSGHDAVMLNGENPIEVQMRDGHKRRAGLGCRGNEFAIELRDVVASQKMVRSIDGPDLSDAQLLR